MAQPCIIPLNSMCEQEPLKSLDVEATDNSYDVKLEMRPGIHWIDDVFQL